MHYFLVVIESARDVKAFYTQIKQINIDHKIIAKIALNQSFGVESCCKQWDMLALPLWCEKYK